MSEVALSDNPVDIMERVITLGDLSKLTPAESVQYYNAVCHSCGLNPLTRPFEYVTLQGKRVLYCRREGADQLRRLHNVSLEVVDRKQVGDMLVVTARATTPTGRKDEDLGAVSIAGLKGEALANQMLKCTTKAKRRVTLSICGLGFLDETEVEEALKEEATPVSTAAQLDAFASGVTEPVVKTAADEVIDGLVAQLDHEARAATIHGLAEFNKWWRTQRHEDANLIRERKPEYEALARVADDANARGAAY